MCIFFQLSSDPTYDKVNKKPLSLQYDEIPTPVPPYLADNDQPPLIPLFHGGDESLVSPFNEPMTTEYSKFKREHITPCVAAAGGNDSILNRDNLSCATFHTTSAKGDCSVLKREEKEVS